MKRILVVDDEPAALRLVEATLDRAGFEIFTAESGPKALDLMARRGLPHLAIVDINMPKMTGFEFCHAVQQFTDLPVILLTAIDEENTTVTGIEHYAEDYIVKPFRPRELVARVDRVLRRMGDFAYTLAPVTRVDDHLAVDFVAQKAQVGDQSVALTPTETKLLYILMRNAGRTVTIDFLLRRLWPMDEIFEDSLRFHVHRLRHKIEPIPSSPCYVLTQRGVGYQFPKLT